MKLVKSHGLGNDYLVLATGEPLTPQRVRRLCDRHQGVGGDGILEPVASSRASAGLRIWNPDGSQAEKSGNGLRIFSRYLVDHRGLPASHTIEVPAGVVAATVHDDGTVTVEMGAPTFEPAGIPATRALVDAPISVAGHTLHVTAVGMGNPHCVVLVDPEAHLDALPWKTWGAALETDARFPNRTNVQIAAVRSRSRVEARIWERGAGPTLASGSSACAIASTTVRLGLTDRRVEVVSPGGTLHLTVDDDGVTLRGPVEEVGEITVTLALD